MMGSHKCRTSRLTAPEAAQVVWVVWGVSCAFEGFLVRTARSQVDALGAGPRIW